MSVDGQQRRLSAILANDVVGYTRLVEQDTDGTVAAWQSARTGIIDPTISEHSGRNVKHTGDGFLAELTTVQHAVQCAITMQEGLVENRLEFRMGINLGDVIDDGEDIHGEGVNIAARIEALPDPGGISISGSVYDQVRNRVDHGFEDMGEHVVKHVTAPVRVYRIVLKDNPPVHSATSESAPAEKPSIAVLPLDNM
jgi:adenylate cyclase